MGENKQKEKFVNTGTLTVGVEWGMQVPWTTTELPKMRPLKTETDTHETINDKSCCKLHCKPKQTWFAFSGMFTFYRGCAKMIMAESSQENMVNTAPCWRLIWQASRITVSIVLVPGSGYQRMKPVW